VANGSPRTALRAAALLAIASVAPCAASCVEAQAPKVPTVSLRMVGGPADASVVIDEESIGTLDIVEAHGVALPPGVHHVTVHANGYFPWDREVEATPGSPPIRLEVTLTPVPD
jgi:hypothetical protein